MITTGLNEAIENPCFLSQLQTTLFFEIEWSDIEDDLNELLFATTNNEDVICEVFESANMNMIVTIECLYRDVAESCYDKIEKWLMGEHIYCSKSFIF